jgi:hypothetical protein
LVERHDPVKVASHPNTTDRLNHKLSAVRTGRGVDGRRKGIRLYCRRLRAGCDMIAPATGLVYGGTVDEALTTAVTEVRDELGTDVYVFIEGDEKHFLGDPLTLGVAAWIIGAFLRGFSEAASGDIEGWGKRTYIWLRDGVKGLLAGSKTDELTGEVEDARRAVATVPRSDIITYADASERALRSALDEYGLDSVSADRVATKARLAGLDAIEA